MIPSAAQQEARTILQHLIPALHATGHWIRMAQPGVSRETKSTRQEIAPTSIHNALTEVDLLAQQSLESSLRPFRDRLQAIGEEDTPYSLLHPPKEGNSHALFCSIDPIDGTFAYCAGAEDYCSMLACFDHRQFHWGAVHFPSLRESMIGSPEEGARVRKIVPHTTDLLDAHLEGGFEEQPYPKSSASEEKCIAVHYRFLLDPFRDRAARLMEQGFHFCTLAGEPSVDWAKPKLVGSNGALLAEVLGGRASAYVGPFTAFHDVAPLHCFFPSDACQFYDNQRGPNHWKPVGLTEVLGQASQQRHTRCRVIMTNDPAHLQLLQACLNEA